MRQTLLEIVQDLLSDMDSDEVNSITDTVESDQVARVVRRVYNDMVEEMDLPLKTDLIRLEDAASVNLPTRLKIPDATSRIEWIKYADLQGDLLDEKHYKNVTWKNPTSFIQLIVNRDPAGDDIQVVEYSTEILLPIQTNKLPSYWTSFDDNYIWFDSWDSDDSSTIVANHSLCLAATTPDFELTDDFVPVLPDNLFPYLYSKAKTVCFNDLKQAPNLKAEQTENRLRIRSQRNKWRQGHILKEGPNFGRK